MDRNVEQGPGPRPQPNRQPSPRSYSNPCANPYPTPAVDEEERAETARALRVSWILVALSVPVTLGLACLGVLMVLLFGDDLGWGAGVMIGIPALLLVATVVLGVRLVRRRPSTTGAGALLAGGLASVLVMALLAG